MSQCDDCSNYEYDDDYGCYTCLVGLDEDDMARFLQSQVRECPFYAFNAEYTLAAKQ